MKKMVAMIMVLALVLGAVTFSASAEVASMKFRITWDAESGRGQAIGKIVDQYNALGKT